MFQLKKASYNLIKILYYNPLSIFFSKRNNMNHDHLNRFPWVFYFIYFAILKRSHCDITDNFM